MIYFGATPTSSPETGWFDGDFWLSLWAQGDLEQQVATLNNYWQNLWRSAGVLGLQRSSPFMVQLDGHMGEYTEWLQEFHDAQLRRALPFASSRDWEEELRGYKAKFDQDFAALVQIGGQAAKTELVKRGTDPGNILIPESTGTKVTKASASFFDSAAQLFAQAARSQWFWPTVLGLGVVAAGVAVVRTSRQTR